MVYFFVLQKYVLYFNPQTFLQKKFSARSPNAEHNTKKYAK